MTGEQREREVMRDLQRGSRCSTSKAKKGFVDQKVRRPNTLFFQNLSLSFKTAFFFFNMKKNRGQWVRERAQNSLCIAL